MSAPASVCLAETCCPGFLAVSLWERVPGAGAHRRGRVWGSLQMCEAAGRLLICHKTISTTPGGLCKRVSQQHVISLQRTKNCFGFFYFFISVCIKSPPCCNVFSGSWHLRKCTRMLYLATTHMLFGIIRHGQRMITWSFRMNTVMVDRLVQLVSSVDALDWIARFRKPHCVCAPGGSLADAILHKEEHGELFSELELKDLLLQVSLGLKYIHGSGLVHLDIKPSVSHCACHSLSSLC